MQDDPNIWRDAVFSHLGGALAFFGGLGGLVRALVLRVSWRETIRVMIVGSATAYGFGTLSPIILRQFLPDLPPEAGNTIGTLCALAFLVGLVNVALIERFVIRERGNG